MSQSSRIAMSDGMDMPPVRGSFLSGQHVFENASRRSLASPLACLGNVGVLHEQQPYASAEEQELLERALLRRRRMLQNQYSQLSSFPPVLDERIRPPVAELDVIAGHRQRQAHARILVASGNRIYPDCTSFLHQQELAAIEKAELDALVLRQQKRARILTASTNGFYPEHAALLREQGRAARFATCIGSGESQHFGRRECPDYFCLSSVSRDSDFQFKQQQEEAILEQQALEEAAFRRSMHRRALGATLQVDLPRDLEGLHAETFSAYAPTSSARNDEDMIHSLLLQRGAERELFLRNRQAALMRCQGNSTDRVALSSEAAKIPGMAGQQPGIQVAEEDLFGAKLQNQRFCKEQNRHSSATCHASSTTDSQHYESTAKLPTTTEPTPSSAIDIVINADADIEENYDDRSKVIKKKRIVAAAAKERLQDSAIKNQELISQISDEEVWKQTTEKLLKMNSFSKDGRSVAKKKQKPKNEDLPRRPLTAYNLFFKAERARLVQEQSEKDKASGRTKKGAGLGISFENLAKIIASRWKSADPQLLEQYKQLAASDATRYHIEMEEYQRNSDANDNKKSKS